MTIDPAQNDNEPLTLMAVRAHPDDECFTVGGTLARCGAAGQETVLVVCTGGENGEIVDEELNTPEIKERLGEVRRQELAESARILGITHTEMLGYRDSGMAGTPENEDPRSFNKADIDDATQRLVVLIRRYKPNVLITDNEEGSYGHPDHIMCNKVSVAADSAAADPTYHPELGPAHQVDTLYFTAFSRSQIVGAWRKMKELGLEMPWRRDDEDGDAEPTWGLPDEEIGAIIDIRDHLDQKRRSLLAHRTQIKPDMWMLTLPEDVFRDFLGFETFQRVRTTSSVEGHQDDIFAA